MSAPIGEQAAELPAVVEGLDLAIAARQRVAVDGDCLTVAPQVTEALVERGFLARTMYLTGWHDQSRQVVAFVHCVSVVGAWSPAPQVVDLTAQQYDPVLPPVWVADLDLYLARLADATSVEAVTLGLASNERTNGGSNG